MHENFKEGDEEDKDEPDINHLDVGGFGKALRHRDQHCDKHQHDCQVHNHGRLRKFEWGLGLVLKPISYLKKEWLEEVGEVGDDNEQDGWYVGGQDSSKQSPDVSCNKTSSQSSEMR